MTGRFWLVSIAAAVVLAGCGGGAGQSNDATAPAATAPAPAEVAPDAAAATPLADAAASADAVPEGNPVLVVETAKGEFEIETYPEDAPQSVAHVLQLVRRRFYNGQRIHRVEPGFVVQFGDSYSRDMSRQDRWGTGGSGSVVGVSEVKRTHRVGAVALAHAGDPTQADSQMYVTLTAVPRLDKDFTVFGQVISGMDVVRQLEVTDLIRRVTVKDAAAPAAP